MYGLKLSTTLFLILALAVLANPLSHAENTAEVELVDHVAGWSVAVDKTLGNSCFIYSSFEGDTELRIGLDAIRQELVVILGDADWKSLEEHKNYTLEIQFSDRSPWEAPAKGFKFSNASHVMLEMRIAMDNDALELFIEEFMTETNVFFKYKGNAIVNLSLGGSYSAAEALFNCQTSTQDSESSERSSAKLKEDPFAA